jgi:hypothetical protein
LEYEVEFEITGYIVWLSLRCTEMVQNKYVDDFIGVKWYEQNYGSGEQICAAYVHDYSRISSIYDKILLRSNHENTSYYVIINRNGTNLSIELWDKDKTN